MSDNPFLITPHALGPHLGRPGLSVVDASWYMPAEGRNARAEFEAGHVPGAVFFDQDAVVEPGSDLPHTLPSPEVFGRAASALGLSATDTIVVYDGSGLFSAPRVWWMLRVFGARDVRILDGGFPAWKAAGLPVEEGPAHLREASFETDFDGDAVVRLEEMRAIVGGRTLQIADARSAERFEGRAPEPRAGVASGHMPGARSLPFGNLQRNGRLKPADELREAFAAAGVDPDAPTVTSCGSGVTAAVLALALESLGNRGVRLYDGSWTEWGSTPGAPVATGPAAND